MNEEIESRVNFLGPLCAIVVLVGAMYWTSSSRADSPRPAEAVQVSAFEYYPAQFVMQAGDTSGGSTPTF